ncbi:MAG: hypothetical protein M3R06_03890 [Chloroflexota bacterium]|nr:hypothetical protein [Chloroflexota bacterium]
MERQIDDLLGRVPGYKGYRAKEDRRDADRRIRDEVGAAFQQRLARVRAIAVDLANQRRVRDIGPIDDLAKTLRDFIQHVETATYGYGGLFGDRNVDELALDQLREFDASLLDGVEELDRAIALLETAFAANTDLDPALLDARNVMRKVIQHWKTRNAVIEAGEVVAVESPLVFLNPPVSAEPHLAYSLRQGGALAILGDNYIVDAVVEIDSGFDSFRLFRLDGGSASSERWLDVPVRPDAVIALVEPNADVFSAGPPSTIGSTPYTIGSGGKGQGTLSGAGGTSGARQVEFWRLKEESGETSALVLDWGNERQVMVGHAVPGGDIEIFGPAAKN